MKWAAYAAAPLAFVAGVRLVRRVVRKHRATLIHAHWAIPSGAIAAAAADDLPLVISLHGSDLFVAERNRLAGWAARRAFRRADRVTGCSADLRDRAVALGADDGARKRCCTASTPTGSHRALRRGRVCGPGMASAPTIRSCSRWDAWSARKGSST